MFPAHCVDYLQSDVYVIPDKHKIKTEPKFIKQLGFPCSSVSKESDYNAGDLGSSPGLGRSPGKGNGNPLQYSCLENPKDRGAWQATVYGVARDMTEQLSTHWLDFPSGTSGKVPACQCRRHKRRGFDPWVEKIPWRRKWQPTPLFLPGKSHGQRSLVGYSPQGCKESHTAEVT